MISQAAYYLAEKRGFLGEHSLDDWLAAEQQVRQVISPISNPELTMNDTTYEDRPKPKEKTPDPPVKPNAGTPPREGISHFEKFAATQAAGDGIQGDTLQKDKTLDEKIGANMADRK